MNTEATTEPNIRHAISEEDLIGIPIIHTQVVNNALGPKTIIISVHNKYRSKNELSKFTLSLVQETMFTQHLLSQLKQIADKLKINKMKIYTNENLFKEISINRLKVLGNENKIHLKIILAEPLREINDQNKQREIISKLHEDILIGGHCGVTNNAS